MGELLALAAVGLLLMLIAIPLYRRRIRPNGLYGLRIPATFKSEEVWFEANHLFARDLFALGLFVLLAALAGAFLDIQGDTYMAALVGMMVISVLVILVVNWRRANRMLREERSRTSDRVSGTG